MIAVPVSTFQDSSTPTICGNIPLFQFSHASFEVPWALMTGLKATKGNESLTNAPKHLGDHHQDGLMSWVKLNFRVLQRSRNTKLEGFGAVSDSLHAANHPSMKHLALVGRPLQDFLQNCSTRIGLHSFSEWEFCQILS